MGALDDGLAERCLELGIASDLTAEVLRSHALPLTITRDLESDQLVVCHAFLPPLVCGIRPVVIPSTSAGAMAIRRRLSTGLVADEEALRELLDVALSLAAELVDDSGPYR